MNDAMMIPQDFLAGGALGMFVAGFIVLQIVFIVIGLISFLLKAWGLYQINKSYGEEYPWLAWIPLVQMYSFVKAGGKSGWWVLWIILGFIVFVIPGIVMVIMVKYSTSKKAGRGIWTTLGLIFFPIVMYPEIGYILSKEKGVEKTEEISIDEKQEL